MASSIAGARTALYDLLAAAPALSGVQVHFGAPAAYEEQEVVALLGVQDPDEEFAAIGAQRKAESYVLEVGVKAYNPGAKAGQGVDTRCFALAEAVRAVVGANPTFAPDTVLPASVTSQTSDGAQPAEGGGWVCFNRILVRCQTRIT